MKSRKLIQASEYSTFLRSSPHIDEVLNHEKTVEEVCCSNPEFSNYLNASRMRELIRYIIEMPEDPTDQTKSCKFPLVASEFFTSDLAIVSKILFQEPSLLQYLFSFLYQSPLNFLQAGYFLKAYECCLSTNPEEFLLFIFQENHNLALLKQMQSSSIAEIVGSILTQNFNKEEKIQFFENVVKLIASDNKLVSYNSTSILCKIGKEDELFEYLLQEAKVLILVENLTKSQSWVVKNSALVLKNLIPYSPDQIIKHFKSFIQPLTSQLSKVSDFQVPTQFGLAIEPVGEARLAVLEIFSLIISSPVLCSEFSDSLPTILNLLPRFYLSSYFHNTFFSLIENILQSSNSSLIEELSRQNFPETLVSMAKTCDETCLARSIKGHIFKLINLLVNSKINLIGNCIQSCGLWNEFEVDLRSYNEIEAKVIGGKANFNFFENMSSDSFDKAEEQDLIPDYPNAKPMTGKELEELTDMFDFEDKRCQTNPFMSTKVVKNASLEELKANEFLDNLFWKVPIDFNNLDEIE